ncbi:uncharacterized protein DMENIID0001_132510 [Sergentomyia squamirostris]
MQVPVNTIDNVTESALLRNNDTETPVDFDTHMDHPIPEDFSTSYSSESEAEDEDDEEIIYGEPSFSDKLQEWAVTHKIPQNAINSLLGILRQEPGLHHLPRDSRTLQKTPESVNIQEQPAGKLWIGSLRTIIRSLLENKSVVDTINLQLHIDGLPIAGSSKSQFWPVQFRILEYPDILPQVVVIFHGEGKPPSLENYLGPMVDDLKLMLQEGIQLNNKNVQIQLHSVIADSPAWAYIKGVVYFNHCHGCTKCTVEGDYYYKQGHHMSFSSLDAAKRTDEDFRLRKDPDHHKEATPFERLPIDMIQKFPVADSLHLFDLAFVVNSKPSKLIEVLEGEIEGNFLKSSDISVKLHQERTSIGFEESLPRKMK